MTAQAAKPTKPAAVKIRRPKPGSKAEAILTLAATTPATQARIAEKVNTTKQNVHQVLERYGIAANRLEDWKKHRADIIAGKAEAILSSIDDDAIKAMPAGQKLMGFGILYDKERLERGQSTVNLAQLVAHVEDLQRIEAE
jgi:hypothetical protein